MANAAHSPQALPFAKANGKCIRLWRTSQCKKNAFAQRAGISKHITAVNYKTYKCKITNFIAQNNKLQVKNNNLQE